MALSSSLCQTGFSSGWSFIRLALMSSLWPSLSCTDSCILSHGTISGLVGKENTQNNLCDNLKKMYNKNLTQFMQAGSVKRTLVFLCLPLRITASLFVFL